MSVVLERQIRVTISGVSPYIPESFMCKVMLSGTKQLSLKVLGVILTDVVGMYLELQPLRLPRLLGMSP